MQTHAFALAATLAAATLALGAPVAHAHAARYAGSHAVGHAAGYAAAQPAHAQPMSEATRRLLMTREFVWFESDSAALSPDSMQSLARFARRLKADQHAVRIEAVGYADATGDDPHNLLLAERRATAVLHYLHTRGVSLLRMSAASYGEGLPMASNATPNGRATNRRVVVVVLPWKPPARVA